MAPAFATIRVERTRKKCDLRAASGNLAASPKTFVGKDDREIWRSFIATSFQRLLFL